ncbi:metal ABC transporter permease [Acetivibrio saccincola]|jgi:manganese/zinc/iron transport system permease protein|uniref:Manganese transport system membrane protein MntB n=1 Tax=Acetivibrio saccincola TaxID=1677857 RepID=A0A2K9DXQ3_9FIRM|nr:metal ABC transporter permease [Acetivibrio saccincola]AUG56292.1 Manganese transport system membrane protein MntB [Acetivibrio saccincola]NLW28235.1 metal ABC transporter permease [Acetivibrio saccincola]PQQ65507.1 zinc ABC transporter permease [Acetivibrio saccincola]HQD29499.1 metal ABC transporter permease [Acetivibrio saccincola]
MISPQFEIQLIAVVTSLACTLAGTFLVLRKMAMMSDAISHSILAGIAIAFLYTKDIHSPLLIVAATATGLVTVFLVEILKNTNLVSEDSAIGLVFTSLFSVGVIIISKYARNVHLDTDAVLLGEIAFAPFRRFYIGNIDLGPKSLYIMTAILIVNILFISLFYKELKISAFDPGLAFVLGFSPGIVHYGLMTVVSITAIGAFDTVGSILVVALMVVPPLTAYLLTDKLKFMILISAILGILSGILGYQAAHLLDVSISGSMATVSGIMFFLAFIISPQKGIIAAFRQYKKVKTSS